MRMYDLILEKRNGGEMSTAEIDELVRAYAADETPDAQMSAWLMAVYFRGMTPRETADLTTAMVRSGRTLDLGAIPGVKVDKHSTGGVGDKTTLVLLPALAAAGVPSVKMAGRSLGYTGGTIDKLESIPGFTTAIPPEQMVEQVKRIGVAIASQTSELVPADKRMYALRDQTATVESIPLIAASVMSKKIAAGADAIVLDVKVGSGAFMPDLDLASRLARVMIEIGEHVGRRTVAAVTEMGRPLGRAIGNAMEVAEAIETLHGSGPDDLVELCSVLGGMALVLAGRSSSVVEGERAIARILSDGSGAAKLRELITAQGGDGRVVDDPSILPRPLGVLPARGESAGWVTGLDALTVARAEAALGGGRGVVGVAPDPAVGVYLLKRPGDRVELGETLAEIRIGGRSSVEEAERLLREAYTISPAPSPVSPLVLMTLGL